MSALALDFREYTFIDVGSGKGRALLLAAEYGFRRIIGIELLPELDRIARANVKKLLDGKGKANQANIELVRSDATEFPFPPEPTIVFLFNPLPASKLRALFRNIEESICRNPRSLYIAYANPVLGHVIESYPWLTKVGSSARYSLFRSLAGR
ncbi:MAG TPA: class I SAM-dependent methyltransferase [Terriglobales bacterium]|nr:class I SAM-dependent methyltransferase [Terriglobales bacterium]